MRIRTIKPEFWKNEHIAKLDDFTQLLAIGLLNYSDDEGYFNANPKLIQADIFPLRDVYGRIPVAVTHLSNLGFLKLYNSSDGRVYGNVVNFLKHQVINKPKPSRIKPLCLCESDSLIDTVQVRDASNTEQGIGTGKRELETIAIPPRGTARDGLFDSLAHATGRDPLQLTKTERGKCEAALAEIKAVCPELTPTEIYTRAARYPQVMPPKSKLTPHALAGNWALCGTVPPVVIPAALDGPKDWRHMLVTLYPDSTYDGPWSVLPESRKAEVVAGRRASA